MITFTKNNQTGGYDVIGPADEVQIGQVRVTKKDGTTTTAAVVKVSKVFVGKFGPLKGQKCRIGTVESRRSNGFAGRSRRIRTPDGELINEDDSCELCGRNKWTCGHCIGW